MLHQAEAQAPNTSLAEAKTAAREGIEALETQLKEVLEKLEAIKSQAEADSARPDVPQPQSEEQVAQEIAQNLEKLVGTTEDEAPVPRSPRVDSNTTSRFTNLQFGKQMRTGVLPSPPSESCRQVRGSRRRQDVSPRSSSPKWTVDGAGSWPISHDTRGRDIPARRVVPQRLERLCLFQ